MASQRGHVRYATRVDMCRTISPRRLRSASARTCSASRRSPVASAAAPACAAGSDRVHAAERRRRRVGEVGPAAHRDPFVACRPAQPGSGGRDPVGVGGVEPGEKLGESRAHLGEHSHLLHRARAGEAVVRPRYVAVPERDPAVHREQLGAVELRRASRTGAARRPLPRPSPRCRRARSARRPGRRGTPSPPAAPGAPPRARPPARALVRAVEVEPGKRSLRGRREREGEVATVADRAAALDRALGEGVGLVDPSRLQEGESEDVLVLVQERRGGRARAGARSPRSPYSSAGGRRAGEAKASPSPCSAYASPRRSPAATASVQRLLLQALRRPPSARARTRRPRPSRRGARRARACRHAARRRPPRPGRSPRRSGPRARGGGCAR